jgi:xanthine dehydrogenase iron-sulfur cluster and FAD-binding subunit A
MVSLNVNGKSYQADVDRRTPLLWVLRDAIGLTGTKYGCGIAQCGACTVHLDGVATRSCSVPVSAVGGCRRDLCWNLIGAISDSIRIRGRQQGQSAYRRVSGSGSAIRPLCA